MVNQEYAIGLVLSYLLVYYLFKGCFSTKKLSGWLWLLKPALVFVGSLLLYGGFRFDLVGLLFYISWITFDGLALYVWPKKGSPLFRFGLAQVVRFGSIILFSRLAILTASPFQTVAGVSYFEILAVIAGWLLVGFMTGDLVGILIKPYSPQEKSGLASGGHIIGVLERSILYLLLLLNSPGGVGFLLTAKTIFRFGEISSAGSSRSQVEYFLIGSLLSFFVGGALSVMWMFLIQSIFPGMPFKLLGG